MYFYQMNFMFVLNILLILLGLMGVRCFCIWYHWWIKRIQQRQSEIVYLVFVSVQCYDLSGKHLGLFSYCQGTESGRNGRKSLL